MVNLELKRVAVTGLGAVTPLGNTVAEWQGLLQGRSGIESITLFDASRPLKEADLYSHQVSCINACGTNTTANDMNETKASEKAWEKHAERVVISSTKSSTGHLLGCSEGVEAVATVMAIGRDKIPPTINLEDPNSACNLDYAAQYNRDRRIEVALSNSFGFKGHNVTLALTKYEG